MTEPRPKQVIYPLGRAVPRSDHVPTQAMLDFNRAVFAALEAGLTPEWMRQHVPKAYQAWRAQQTNDKENHEQA